MQRAYGRGQGTDAQFARRIGLSGDPFEPPSGMIRRMTDTIRSWHQTEYQWLKIQSATDAKFWHEVKAYGPSLSRADRKIRLADR